MGLLFLLVVFTISACMTNSSEDIVKVLRASCCSADSPIIDHGTFSSAGQGVDTT